jgi:hypothetical protein
MFPSLADDFGYYTRMNGRLEGYAGHFPRPAARQFSLPDKNIENNPMYRNKWSRAQTLSRKSFTQQKHLATKNILTRRANHLHIFTITKLLPLTETRSPDGA